MRFSYIDIKLVKFILLRIFCRELLFLLVNIISLFTWKSSSQGDYIYAPGLLPFLLSKGINGIQGKGLEKGVNIEQASHNNSKCPIPSKNKKDEKK